MKISDLAISKLNTDFTNDYVVPDRVSCAYAVTTILHEFDPDIPIMPSTYDLWQWLQNSPKFVRVYDPQAGDLIVSPTGTSTDPDKKLSNGHTGIFIDEVRICSNSSATGLWQQNYTRLEWRKFFHEYGQYPSYLFRHVDNLIEL